MKGTEEAALEALHPQFLAWNREPQPDPAEELAVRDEEAVAEWKEQHE